MPQPKEIRREAPVPFLPKTATLCLTHSDDASLQYCLCIVPELLFPEVARAFEILSGANESKRLDGFTSRFGGTLYVIVPDTVTIRTLSHEAVHLARGLGLTLATDDDEEVFALLVGSATADMVDIITELRGHVDVPTPKRRRKS